MTGVDRCRSISAVKIENKDEKNDSHFCTIWCMIVK